MRRAAIALGLAAAVALATVRPSDEGVTLAFQSLRYAPHVVGKRPAWVPPDADPCERMNLAPFATLKERAGRCHLRGSLK